MLNLLIAFLFACLTPDAHLREASLATATQHPQMSPVPAPTPTPAPAAKALIPAWVGPGYSGSWYNAARAGEGWTLQILDDGSAVVVWFTYAPPGTSNPQAWILAQNGKVTGNTIRFTDVYTARGGNFGPGFDPAQVVLEPWGELTFVFDSCTSGSMTYAGPAAYGAGSHTITRLTTLDELDCAGTRRLTTNGAREASALRSYAGAWVDPSHGGEGWVVEPFSATQAGVYWFTYTPTGSQAWLLGIGTLTGNRLRIDALLRPVGTEFGAGFDAARVDRAAWGTLELEFGSCNGATVRYTSTQSGFGSGTLNAQRLTSLASAKCLDTLRTAQVQGQWTQGTRMPIRTSEVASVEIGGKLYSAGGYSGLRHFERYDPATDTWAVLPELPSGRDHAMTLVHGNRIWVIGGYVDDGKVARFDLATNSWESLPDAPGVAASGSTLLNGYFYLGDDTGDLVQFDPITQTRRRIPGMDITPRDHSQVIAYLGEIWMMGGRSGATREQNRVTIFDPVGETWRRGPSMRVARGGFAAAVLNDQIMVAGGEVLFSGLLVLDRFEVIAPGQNTWQFGPDLPAAVHGVGGVSFDGRFYAVGGSATAGIADNPGVIQIYAPAP